MALANLLTTAFILVDPSGMMVIETLLPDYYLLRRVKRHRIYSSFIKGLTIYTVFACCFNIDMIYFVKKCRLCPHL